MKKDFYETPLEVYGRKKLKKFFLLVANGGSIIKSRLKSAIYLYNDDF